MCQESTILLSKMKIMGWNSHFKIEFDAILDKRLVTLDIHFRAFDFLEHPRNYFI